MRGPARFSSSRRKPDAGLLKGARLTILPCNAPVKQMKTFNARLAESDLKKFAAKARRKGVSQTALLREWIHARDIPTAADAGAWEIRNAGNPRLRISRG